MIRYLLETGFHVSNVFSHATKGEEGVLTETEKSIIKNTALLLAIDRGSFTLLSFLTGEGFMNYWNTSDLKSKAYNFLSSNHLQQLVDYLSSPLATNIYLLKYTQYQRMIFVKNLYQLFKA
jgi:hypothetical protein